MRSNGTYTIPCTFSSSNYFKNIVLVITLLVDLFLFQNTIWPLLKISTANSFFQVNFSQFWQILSWC
jgi:hypothetical protein